MEQAFASDDDDFDSQPTGLLEMPSAQQAAASPAPDRASKARAERDNSGVVPTEIDPKLLEKLQPVDALFARLGTATHYELLGVAPSATTQEIRRAYSQLAKRFHPDVYFRKSIGDYRRKLERVFTALTEAHNVLNSAERDEYDASLGIAPEARARPEERRSTNAPRGPAAAEVPRAHAHSPRVSGIVERVAGSAPPVASQVISTAPPRPAPHPSAPAAPEPARVTTTRPPPVAARYAVEDVGRPRAPAVTVQSQPPSARPAPQSASPGSTPPRARSELAFEALQRELSRRQTVPPGSVSIPPSQRPGASSVRSSSRAQPLEPGASIDALVAELECGGGLHQWAAARLREARAHERGADLRSALNTLQLALARFPDQRLREQRDRVREQLARGNIDTHRQRAVQAEQAQQPREAMEAWHKVLEGNPGDLEAALRAALSAFQARDIKRAGQFAKRAVELAPNDARAHHALLRFYELMGMETSAARERELLKRLRTP